MTISLESLKEARFVERAMLGTPEGNYPETLEALFPAKLMDSAVEELTQWPGYKPTGLESLSHLASYLKVGAVHYKDESTRFGLGSFKALGGAYAVLVHLQKTLSADSHQQVSLAELRSGNLKDQAAKLTVATATDGNHGRSVAWGAQQAGCACKIYIHRDVSVGREQAMAALGADVVRIDGDYDESVRQCAHDARQHGWQVISDTSYPGYMDIPKLVMAGYTVMVEEILQQMDGTAPSHVFIQAGVGGLAAAMTAAFWQKAGDRLPRIIVVESQYADCILASAKNGVASQVVVETETLMAGLSCGEISLIAWEILKRGATDVVTISDDLVAPVMKLAALGKLGEKAIEAGECGTPGIIALAAACASPLEKQRLGLNEQSRILVFGCEGATDPDIYHQLIAG